MILLPRHDTQNHGTKSKIQWYRWKEMCTDPIDRIAIYIIWKWRAASICVEVLWYTVKKTLFLSVYVNDMMMGHGLKNNVKLMYFWCEHFDLKESTSVLSQMGCASRECKQNMKICVCDILRYDQKVIWKRKMWSRHQEKLLQHGRTERPGIFRRTDKSLMTLCSEKIIKGRCPTIRHIHQFQRVVQDCSDCATGHIWILISRPVRSLQSWSKDRSSVKERSTWYDSSTYWIKKPFPGVILRSLLTSWGMRNIFVQLH